ncbi:cof-like hydrolase [Eggerthia catenaformis OT 569 = DSM 20559]|uniref:Cof-like hydrolase n=1 Tax=Eggerthia catenaformis OT 569 = DSM 20559 TaxID=999415 RepID=M2Q0D9_9FIRM|nr:HAD family hydrolase [Eggerthia catenaformis]EMD16390.1 cof-like hydrolase [Eggerthia catenaformis OT 569 = DSM 20559]OUC52202.1 hypothetical protein B7939_01930 [Eggerthia catenaformis]
MNSKLLCFDVDGTLRDNTVHKISMSTLNSIKHLKALGHKMIISTGRGYDSLKNTQIFDILEWDGYVLNNGQLILNQDQCVIKEYHMNPQSVMKTIATANQLDMPVVLKMKKRLITRKPNKYVYQTQKYFDNVIPEVRDYNGKDNVYAMILYSYPGDQYEAFRDIKGIHVDPGKSAYADVSIEGLSKATGNLLLADLFGYNNYIAFGDSQNDLEMFKYASLSICMGDGDPAAKEKADYITDTLANDGIYNACVYFNWFIGDENND